MFKKRILASSRLVRKTNSRITGAYNESIRGVRTTKVFAREWYEYAKVAGKDATKALQLCTSAAGTEDYCVSK